MMAVVSLTAALSYVAPMRRPVVQVAAALRRPLTQMSAGSGTFAERPPVQQLTLGGASSEQWSQVVEALAPFAKANRVERLNEVLSRRRGGLHLVLENVADPYNVAAVLRTAEGLGIQNVHTIESMPHSTHRTGGKKSLSNVAMGASRWLTLTRYKSAELCYAALREHDLQIVASDCPPCEGEEEGETVRPRGNEGHGGIDARPVGELDFGAARGGIALVFGNERRGVSKAAIEHADGSFFIPMSGLTQSFNISVAVAMSLYAVIASGRFPEGSLSDADRLELMGKWLMRDVKAARPLLLKQAGIEFTDF